MFDFLNGLYKYIAIATIVALDLLLILWGASLLYRGLDGDRITLKRPVKGRWTNPTNLLLVFAGLAVLLLGAALGLMIVLTVSDDASNTTFWRSLLSILVLTAAIVMISWAWAGRRAAGKPRCPQCFYDVSAIPGMTCPECGYQAETSGHWYKPKKRKRWITASVLLVLVGLIGLQTDLISRNWRRVLPTTFLINRMDTLPEFIVGSPRLDHGYSAFGYRVEPAHPGGLFDRVTNSELSQAQLESFRSAVEKGIAQSRSPEDLVYWILSADYAYDTIYSVSFSPAEAEDFINMALLQERSRIPSSDQSWARIDWVGFDALDEQVRVDLATRLFKLAHESLDDSMMRVRYQVALTLHPKPEKLVDQIIRTLAEHEQASQSQQAQIIISACVEVVPELIIQGLFDAMLEAEDSKSRTEFALLCSRTVELFRRSSINPVSLDSILRLSPSERHAAVQILGQSVSQRLHDTDFRNAFYSDEARTARALLPLLMTLTEFDTLANAISAGDFTDADLAVFWSYATSPDTLILIPELLSLAGHESDAVRAATAFAVASETYTTSSYNDSLGDLIVQIRDYPHREDLLYSFNWLELDEPWDKYSTPASDPDRAAIPDVTAPNR